MHPLTFDKVLNETWDKVEAILKSKGEEYSTELDKLHNFKKAANMKGESPREALGGMMIKHTVSIYDLIAKEESALIEVWDEKIIDHINYLILLRAIVLEELEGNCINAEADSHLH